MYLIVISPPLQNKFKFVNVYKYIHYTFAWVFSTNISKNLIFDILPDRRHFTNKYIMCLLEFWASIMVPISFWYVAWPSERLCGWHTLFVIILKVSRGEIIVILSFFYNVTSNSPHMSILCCSAKAIDRLTGSFVTQIQVCCKIARYTATHIDYEK